jgi:hypothetical protein
MVVCGASDIEFSWLALSLDLSYQHASLKQATVALDPLWQAYSLGRSSHENEPPIPA